MTEYLFNAYGSKKELVIPISDLLRVIEPLLSEDWDIACLLTIRSELVRETFEILLVFKFE